VEQLLVVNPAHRPKKRSGHRKGVMPPGLKRYWATHSRKSHARKSNPSSHKVRTRTIHHHHRARRRNPIGLGGMMMPVMQGTVGALGVNALMGLLPLPVTMQTGLMKRMTEAGLAILLGMVGGKFLGRAAAEMAKGSLIVTAAHTVSDLVGPSFPSLALSGIPGYNAGANYAPFNAISEEAGMPFEHPNRSMSIMRGLSNIPEY
jgi:hypothetical protein